jgi:mannose-6-phosphate isomerase-like protein (cupin superfamily)
MATQIPVPSPDAYSREPVRYPSFTLVDLVAEANGYPRPYHNSVLNQVNGHCLRLSAFEGIYPWHRHPGSDELFLVVDGQLFIDFPDAPSVCVEPHQVFTVPAGRIHRTRAESRVVNVCFEERGAATEFVPGPPG